jgi:Kef-type K+ transport system membrane component KefB
MLDGDVLPLFLLQITVIAASAHILGRLFRRFGQPGVIGEMTAGIALGPSLFGWLAPHLHQALFPEASLGLLNLIGQLGLIFYMFLVGLTLNLQHLKEQRAVALASSISSIAVPFVSGFALAVFLYRRLSLPNVPLLSFALFVAVCMSITAFPVLARILQETGLMETRLGSVAIASAAIGDVAAWLILAVILAFSAGSVQHRSLGLTLGLLTAYLAAMAILRLGWSRFGEVSLAAALIVAMLSSIATEWIGVHALFGAFFAGVMIPKTLGFVEAARRMVEPLTTAIFLPVFFAFTGLRTRFGLLLEKETLSYTLMILAVAVAGKWLGAMLAARSMGMGSREANALGILMNTRGLVELVILTIGFDLGLISPTVFSMMVLMALLTTLMTAPLVHRVYSRPRPSTGSL